MGDYLVYISIMHKGVERFIGTGIYVPSADCVEGDIVVNVPDADGITYRYSFVYPRHFD